LSLRHRGEIEQRTHDIHRISGALLVVESSGAIDHVRPIGNPPVACEAPDHGLEPPLCVGGKA
jgi:hypothetical protein